MRLFMDGMNLKQAKQRGGAIPPSQAEIDSVNFYCLSCNPIGEMCS